MTLHVVVCIKSVVIKAPEKSLVRLPDALELNPFDRPVLEAALQMRDEQGGTVTALSMGPRGSSTVLLEAKAMGVDRMVLICDAALKGSDTLATSTALAAALKKLAPFDLVLFGTRTADSDTGQVGPQTAVLLGLPLVTGAHRMTWKGQGFFVERRADGFVENFQVSLPAALTVHSNAVQPRDIALGGIETAFEEGKVAYWDLSDLGLSEDQVGWAGSATRVASWRRVTRDRTCEFLSGTSEEQVKALINRLGQAGLIAS